MKTKTWNPVPGIEGIEVTRDGRIRRMITWNGALWWDSSVRKNHGYKVVSYNGKTFSVHRLIALTFIKNRLSKQFINHKNGNKEDNHYRNLEWCTVQENNRHSYHVLDNNSQYPKRKIAIFKDGEKIAEAISVREAARIVGGASTNVSKVCQGKRKQHNGFTFQYIDDFVLPKNEAPETGIGYQSLMNL